MKKLAWLLGFMLVSGFFVDTVGRQSLDTVDSSIKLATLSDELSLKSRNVTILPSEVLPKFRVRTYIDPNPSPSSDNVTEGLCFGFNPEILRDSDVSPTELDALLASLKLTIDDEPFVGKKVSFGRLQNDFTSCFDTRDLSLGQHFAVVHVTSTAGVEYYAAWVFILEDAESSN